MQTIPWDAAAYDRKVAQSLPYYALFHAQVISAVRALFDRPVSWLDTGCGTGTLARRAAEAVPLSRLVLSDPSPEMLALARQRMDGVPAEFWSLPSGQLPERESFDVVTAILCHHYLSPAERRAATQRCFEALRPGGVYITFEHTAPRTDWGKALVLRRWDTFQQENGRDAETVSRHLARYGTEYFPITMQEHWKLLEDTGFDAAELLWSAYLDVGLIARRPKA